METLCRGDGLVMEVLRAPCLWGMWIWNSAFGEGSNQAEPREIPYSPARNKLYKMQKKRVI